jgi:subtilisin family serine protease
MLILLGTLLLLVVFTAILASCSINNSARNMDPLFESQWGLHNDGIGEKVKFNDAPHDKAEFVKNIDINAIEMREKQQLYKKNIKPIVVAVIDTAIDFTHEDLAGTQWINEGEIPDDGLDNDGNGYLDDVSGFNFSNDAKREYNLSDSEHGTMCAGIIAAQDNGIGINGVAALSNIKLMSLVIYEAEESGELSASPKELIEAIIYAENMGADICNLSLELRSESEALKECILNSDMLFVVSAGYNNNPLLNTDIEKKPIYPASYNLDNTISVASVGTDGRLSSFSNKGGNIVDLAAPGDCILSTAPNNEYHYFSGCSAAVSFVTGVATVLYATDENSSPEKVKNSIVGSVNKVSYLKAKVKSGGILNGGESIDLFVNSMGF